MNLRDYEALYIVDPTADEAAVNKLIEKFNGVVTGGGGEIEKSEIWERRKLTFEINGKREGTFCIMFFSAPAALPKELTRQFGITESVMRARIYIREKPKEVEPKKEAKKKAKAADKPAEKPTEAPVEAPPAVEEVASA